MMLPLNAAKQSRHEKSCVPRILGQADPHRGTKIATGTAASPWQPIPPDLTK